MGRPPIGREKMSGAERTRRYRAKLRAAHAQVVAEGHKPDPMTCAWCGRSGMLVGDRGVMICGPCIEAAGVAVREARAARKRAVAVKEVG